MAQQTTNNTGFGNNANDNAGRFFNEQGQPNVRKIGLPLKERYSSYHWLISMPTWKFFSVVLIYFIVVNFLFALVYQLIGLEHLVGMVTDTAKERFQEAFFFSCQTFTTVGYGRVNPVGFTVNLVSSFEALCGYLSFALVTGLLYGRFSLPKANIKFSDNALIAPYKDGFAFMCRFSNYKQEVLTDASANISVGVKEIENGVYKNKFYNLNLEIPQINALYLSWTLVHPINEESPFWGMSFEEIKQKDLEFFIFIKAYDEKFSNSVLSRKSYLTSDLIFNAKFVPMFYPSEDRSTTVLDFSKINDFFSEK